MQASQGAGLAGFDFDGVNFSGSNGEVVHLGAAASCIASPIEQFTLACGQHFLGDELFGKFPPIK